MRFFIAVLIIVSVLALAATISALIIGVKSFEGLVVEKPYETGLAWDEMQKQKANLNNADTAAADDRADCDIQRGPCRRETRNGLSVELDAQPKPVTAMAELDFIVRLKINGMPLNADSVMLDLSMPGMTMGKNQPVLAKVGDGRYEGRGIITRCMSGRKIWLAEVVVKQAQNTDLVDFLFEVK
jgi:nitrogen fixation protein FixH